MVRGQVGRSDTYFTHHILPAIGVLFSLLPPLSFFEEVLVDDLADDVLCFLGGNGDGDDDGDDDVWVVTCSSFLDLSDLTMITLPPITLPPLLESRLLLLPRNDIADPFS